MDTERAETATSEDVDTARLVARFKKGDREVFGELYARYFDRVYSYLRLLVHDRHQAEELVQQAFTQVFEALSGYEERGRPFRAWLFIVVRNLAISHLRQRDRVEPDDPARVSRRRERAAGAANGADDELAALQWINDADILLFIERLSLAQRQVVVMRYTLDLSVAQIAEILDRSPNDIRVLQHRALAFLRDRLTAIGRAPTNERSSRMRVCPRQAPVLRSRRFALK